MFITRTLLLAGARRQGIRKRNAEVFCLPKLFDQRLQLTPVFNDRIVTFSRADCRFRVSKFVGEIGKLEFTK